MIADAIYIGYRPYALMYALGSVMPGKRPAERLPYSLNGARVNGPRAKPRGNLSPGEGLTSMYRTDEKGAYSASPSVASSLEQPSCRIMDGVPLAKAVFENATLYTSPVSYRSPRDEKTVLTIVKAQQSRQVCHFLR